VLRRFADGLRAIAETVGREDPNVRALSPEVAMAAVGGINELLLQAVEDEGAAALPQLTDTAVEFLAAIFEGRA
jgi:hypothetical protein